MNSIELQYGGVIYSDKYEICIGNCYNLDTGQKEPKQTIIITREQLYVIETFADIEQDAELNKVYTLNKCKFTVKPHFEEPVPSATYEDFLKISKTFERKKP